MSDLSNTQIQQKADTLLKSDAFQQYLTSRGSTDWWEKFLRWLQKFWNMKFPFEAYGKGLHVMGYLFKILFACAILFLILYVVLWLIDQATASQDAQQGPDEFVTPEQREKARQSFLEMANQALAEKDYGKAIHYMFLASVSLVIKAQHFHVSEFMTNREIAAATDLSGDTQGRGVAQIFYDMLAMDEPRWFGTVMATLDDYTRFSQLFQQFDRQIRGAILHE